MNDFIVSYSKNNTKLISSDSTVMSRNGSRKGSRAGGRLTKQQVDELSEKLYQSLNLDDKPWKYDYEAYTDPVTFRSYYYDYTAAQATRIVNAIVEKIESNPTVQQYKSDPLSLFDVKNDYEKSEVLDMVGGDMSISSIQGIIDNERERLAGLDYFDEPISSSDDIDKLKTNDIKCSVISEERKSEFPTSASVYNKFKDDFSGMQSLYEEITGVQNPPGMVGTTGW